MLGAIRVGEDDGRAALLVDGVVQSISPGDALERGGYWAAMLPVLRPRRALILGLGGGTLAQLISHRWGLDVSIVGVDHSAAVLEVARAQAWLDLPNLEVVQADAFEYVQTCVERFDYAAIDLYDGPRFVGRGLTRPFLQRLRALLEPPAEVAVNLFRDARTRARLERLGRVLRVERCIPVGDNVVVHARARR